MANHTFTIGEVVRHAQADMNALGSDLFPAQRRKIGGGTDPTRRVDARSTRTWRRRFGCVRMGQVRCCPRRDCARAGRFRVKALAYRGPPWWPRERARRVSRISAARPRPVPFQGEGQASIKDAITPRTLVRRPGESPDASRSRLARRLRRADPVRARRMTRRPPSRCVRPRRDEPPDRAAHSARSLQAPPVATRGRFPARRQPEAARNLLSRKHSRSCPWAMGCIQPLRLG